MRTHTQNSNATHGTAGAKYHKLIIALMLAFITGLLIAAIEYINHESKSILDSYENQQVINICMRSTPIF